MLMEQTEEAGTEVGSLRPSFSEGRAELASRENILLWSQPNPLLFRPNNRGDGSAPTWLVPLLNQTDGKKIEGTRDLLQHKVLNARLKLERKRSLKLRLSSFLLSLFLSCFLEVWSLSAHVSSDYVVRFILLWS